MFSLVKSIVNTSILFNDNRKSAKLRIDSGIPSMIVICRAFKTENTVNTVDGFKALPNST